MAESKDNIREVEGIVAQVSDGDTFKLETKEGTILKVRLYGIDAPETPKMNHKTGVINKPGQPFGLEAQRALEVLILGKQARIEILAIDRYKRMVCIVRIDNKNVNLEMLQAGMAEAYTEYLRKPYLKPFEQVENRAKSLRIGIWSLGDKYERPSEFRKRLRIRGK